jgi:two-component sensor histidine kinase/CheY-like chemotaxis protein
MLEQKSEQKRLMVIEDETDFLNSIKVALVKSGYRPTLADNGKAGLEKIMKTAAGTPPNSLPYDLIITDIQMPHMSGLELIRAIREKGLNIPIMAMTGYGDKKTVVELMRLGCMDYLDKPFTPEMLIRRIEDILERTKNTENQTKDKEKELLLKEIHHRVKNNMQVISSLLNLQAQKVKSKKALEVIKKTRSRIYAMALVHENLYNTDDFSQIPFKEYIETITKQLFQTWGTNDGISCTLQPENISLDIDTAIPLGMIINELVTNSLRHAFPGGREGRLRITFRSLPHREVELTVQDNGVGIPGEIDWDNLVTTGLFLVYILSKQIDASITVKRKKGTTVTLRFKQ